MSLAVVNGYVCMSGCDAAKARKGQDPREFANGMDAGNAKNEKTGAQKPGETAVLFGGALAALQAANRVEASPGSAASGRPTVNFSVNFFV